MSDDTLFAGIIILSLVILVCSILYFVFFIIIRANITIRRKKFFTALLRGLETETVRTLEDVIVIYSGVVGHSYELDASKYFIGNELKKFLISLLTADSHTFYQKYTSANFKCWKDIITSWLEELKRETPYSEVPDVERNILQEIGRLLDSKEIEGVKGRIKELSGRIQLRNEEYEKSRKINHRGFIFSIAGVVITSTALLFAIYVFFKPVKLDEAQLKSLINLQQAQQTHTISQDVNEKK